MAFCLIPPASLGVQAAGQGGKLSTYGYRCGHEDLVMEEEVLGGRAKTTQSAQRPQGIGQGREEEVLNHLLALFLAKAGEWMFWDWQGTW